MKIKLSIIRNIVICVISFFLLSCQGKFDFSPYVINFSEGEKQVHQKNQKWLLENEISSDTISIAFTGDSHRFYDELNAFTQAVNNKHQEQPIDLAIHVGDLADFGLPRQYQWGNGFLKQLEIPYFVVIEYRFGVALYR